MCEPYYQSMLDYVHKGHFFTLNLINRNKYIMTCFINFEQTTVSTLLINVFHRHDKKFSVSVKKDTLMPDDLKNLLKLIENQAFCLKNNCRTTIFDNKDMVGDICFKCAFYNDYQKVLNESECSICLENNSIQSIELNCGHIFHKDCLLKACQKGCGEHYHCSCPLCRCEILFDKFMNQLNICETSDAFGLDHVDTDDTI